MGKLLYKGKLSRSDTIVYSNRMDTKWWIKSRSRIEPEDLADVLKAKPEVVVVGLGFTMPIAISDAAVNALNEQGIEVHVEKSERAAEPFNQFAAKKEIVGLFHLL